MWAFNKEVIICWNLKMGEKSGESSLSQMGSFCWLYWSIWLPPAAERDSSSTAFIHSKVWLTPRLHTNTAAHRGNWLTAWRHRVSAVSHPETHRGQIRTEVSHNTVFTVDWRQHRRSDALLFWYHMFWFKDEIFCSFGLQTRFSCLYCILQLIWN